jgi:hypothetical protein
MSEKEQTGSAMLVLEFLANGAQRPNEHSRVAALRWGGLESGYFLLVVVWVRDVRVTGKRRSYDILSESGR